MKNLVRGTVARSLILPLSFSLAACGASEPSTGADNSSAGSAGANSAGTSGTNSAGSGGASSAGSGGSSGTSGVAAGGAGTSGAGGSQAGSSGSAGTGGSETVENACGALVGAAGASSQEFSDPCITAGTCPEGVWSKLDLPGFSEVDRVQTVLVDPVRAIDFYAFVGSNGGPTIKVYRSTDFGNTWTNINTTAGITGNPWGASIDPNPARDPDTSPTLWSPSGYGANGAWKSTDGGVTWTRSSGCDAAFGPYNPFGALLTDLYHIQILPDDPPHHILATYHYGFKDAPAGGFGESWDGGETWVVHPPPAEIGTSHYVMPISATTWAVIAQENSGANGIWRTTTAGRTGGTAEEKFRDGTISVDAWTKVDTLEHAHGSHQNLILKDGTILATGNGNGARSTDCGATWSHFTANGVWAPPNDWKGSHMTNIAATDSYIYTNNIYSPSLARAPIDDPIGAEKWTTEYCDVPADMTDGSAVFSMATSYDGANQKWIILSGANHAGLFKYVEP